MASQTAKGKRKTKGKTLDLNTFLGENQDAPTGFAVVNTRRIDWGDAMENEEIDDKYTLDFKKEDKVVLPTAPKAARGPDIDLSKVPTRPPYTAFLGNLPYDVSEEDIANFFRQLQVTNVRLPRDNGERGRIKGFGYAEFQDRQDLIQALALNSESLKNRAIKVSLAGEHDGDRDRRGDGGPDRTLGDWRSGGSSRDEPSRNDSYQSRGFSDRDSFRGRSSTDKDYGFQRDRNERNGDRYERSDYGFRNDRDFGRDQDRRSNDRGYGFSGSSQRETGGRMERSRDYGSGRDFGGGRDFGSSRDYGSGRRDDFSRESRFRDSSDREPPSRDSYERRPERPSDQGPDGPKERRKLQLTPRTKPIEPTPPPSEATASSIFGGAKPVDTAAREREIEARLAREKDVTVPSVRESKESTTIAECILNEGEDSRPRRLSTGSGVSNRSYRSSDSGPPPHLRDEDEPVSTNKPPLPRQVDHDKEHSNTLPKATRQRCSSTSSTGSERDNQNNSKANLPPSNKKENGNSNYYPRSENSDNASHQNNSEDNLFSEDGYKSVKYNHSHRDISNERAPRVMTLEEPKPPVYASTNKFSHLVDDTEELDKGSGSE